MMIEVSAKWTNRAIHFVAERTGTTAANMKPAIGAAAAEGRQTDGRGGVQQLPRSA